MGLGISAFYLGFTQTSALITAHRVVLANGTTRLQLDITKSSGLHFHMLFSSQLLGLTKVTLVLVMQLGSY